MGDVISDLPVPAKGIFLSYSHRDCGAALKLKDNLERLGVGVRFDLEAMQPGQEIRRFILDSIRATGATVWVVSEASLISDWVAVEIVTSLTDAELWQKRVLVACYLDEGFLDLNFRLRATKAIDARINEIDGLIREYQTKSIDTDDLNAEKTRLFRLRNDLGMLLARLRDSLCLDVRDGQFEMSVRRLANTLRSLVPSVQRPSLRAAVDVGQRRDEIYALIGSGDGKRALERLMDFVRDFAEDKRRRDVVVIMMNFRRLEEAQGVSLKEVREERTEIVRQALQLLDDVVEVLTRQAA